MQNLTLTLLVGNDMILELASLQNTVTADYVNDAAVYVTLLDLDGVEVAGQAWPLQMPYVVSSSGLYRAELPATVELVDKTKYTARIDVTSGAMVARWDAPTIAKLRRE